MHITLLALLSSLLIGSTSAIDKVARRAQFCVTYAQTDEVWTEDNLHRRRVVYDTTKNLVPYDGEMYSLGWRWANERDACQALTHNIKVYYNGLVMPGGAYVVDSSEKLGPSGDMAHECLLGKFRDMLGETLNCTGEDGRVRGLQSEGGRGGGGGGSSENHGEDGGTSEVGRTGGETGEEGGENVQEGPALEGSAA